MKTNDLTRPQLAEEKQLSDAQLERIAGGLQWIAPGPSCGVPKRLHKPHKETPGDGGATGSW